MGLLEKLKSLFGSGEERPASGPGDPEVTVEHEPAAESEHAVKGTDATATGGPTDAAATGETSDATATGEATDAASSGGAAGATASDATADAGEVTAATGTAASGGEGDSPPVEEIKGIGPTYSDRLAAAGIETVADLTGTDPETVAEAAETSRSRAEGWVERARER
jgi:predicted flap endonuclease-1-like 5' DNA nuclease